MHVADFFVPRAGERCRCRPPPHCRRRKSESAPRCGVWRETVLQARIPNGSARRRRAAARTVLQPPRGRTRSSRDPKFETVRCGSRLERASWMNGSLGPADPDELLHHLWACPSRLQLYARSRPSRAIDHCKLLSRGYANRVASTAGCAFGVAREAATSWKGRSEKSGQRHGPCCARCRHLLHRPLSEGFRHASRRGGAAA